jgi:hypothetical protein
METMQAGLQTWYKRGQFWYKKPSGSAAAHELRVCSNPECRAGFFGRRGERKASYGKFCSVRCSRRGTWNPQWGGDAIHYRGAHARVARTRGKANHCSVIGCCTGGTRFHWANLTGLLADPADYASMCVFHHRAYDWARILGISPAEALDRIRDIPPSVQAARSRSRCI